METTHACYIDSSLRCHILSQTTLIAGPTASPSPARNNSFSCIAPATIIRCCVVGRSGRLRLAHRLASLRHRAATTLPRRCAVRAFGMFSRSSPAALGHCTYHYQHSQNAVSLGSWPKTKSDRQQLPRNWPQPSSAVRHSTARGLRTSITTMAASTCSSIRDELSDLFRAALAAKFPDVKEEPLIAACTNIKFGHYQCNNAMPLFGKVKGKEGAPKAPRDVATALVSALPANSLIVETSLAGPGFVNCRLSKAYLASRLQNMLKDGVETWSGRPELKGKRVVVDFSSPNVAKEMHVGHLRSTIIGDTLCRVLEFCGADVLRLNHVGDWGTQFGMLIQHMSEGGMASGGKEDDVSDLQQLYRAAKQRFDEEEDFKTRAREAVTRLQSGEASSMASWQRICAASRREFEAIYSRLGVSLQERGESYYNPMLKEVVGELAEKGVAREDGGAMCVFVDGFNVPLIIQKSDGGFGYATTDLAAVKQRLNAEKAEWIIYVTDSGQGQHFELVFAAAREAGWLPADRSASPRVDHVGFGLVLGDDGKRFRTRSGDLVKLVDLLDEAKARCAASLRERRAEAGEAVDEAEVEAVSSAMGYGAVKYADLKNHRTTNYKFSYDDMLALKGNTAVYLLYAHARIAGIVRKSGKDMSALASSATLLLDDPKEEDLALHIARFPEALADCLADLAPNRLTDYLYELSEKFNSFYVDCKVLGSDQEDSRLLLVESTARVMRATFGLLGITPLYKI